jgi:hypothetical protein
MPVKRRTVGVDRDGAPAALVEELVDELREQREFGQPLIEVETFPRTGLVGVTVLWDKWDGLPDIQRTAVILEAYTRANGESAASQVAFAIGMTTAEAAEIGKLPYAIRPQVKPSDGVNPERVRAVAQEVGSLCSPGSGSPPVMRFSSLEEAEACRKTLIEKLPGSDTVWAITHETGGDWSEE